MDFTLEALKRYLVMQLIETSSMQNSKDIMGDINQNALETAKTMKGINEMFGNRNQPPQQQPQYQPNILNQPNPFYQPPVGQVGYPQQEDMNYFKTEIRNSLSQMKSEMNDLKAQIFDGLQSLNHAITQLVHSMQNDHNNQNNKG